MWKLMWSVCLPASEKNIHSIIVVIVWYLFQQTFCSQQVGNVQHSKNLSFLKLMLCVRWYLQKLIEKE